MERISRIKAMLEDIDAICSTKKNMFLPIREGITEVFHELQQLRQDAEYTGGLAGTFEYQLEKAVDRKVKLARAQSVTSVRNIPDLRKTPKELTMSLQDTAAKKPVVKRPKVSHKERDVKKRVKFDKLGVTARSIRESHSKDLLVELRCSKKDRGWLATALKEVIGANGSVRLLIPRIEVVIVGINPSIEAEDVEEAIRGFFNHGSEIGLNESLIKRLYSIAAHVLGNCELNFHYLSNYFPCTLKTSVLLLHVKYDSNFLGI